MSYDPCPFCGILAEQRFPGTHKCPGRAQGIAAATGRTPVWGPSPQEAEIAALKARIAELLDQREQRLAAFDGHAREMRRLKEDVSTMHDAQLCLKARAAAAEAEIAALKAQRDQLDISLDIANVAIDALLRRLTAAEAESARLAALLTEAREAIRRIVWAHDETDGGDLTEAIDASRSLLVRLAPPTPESAP